MRYHLLALGGGPAFFSVFLQTIEPEALAWILHRFFVLPL